MFASGGVYVHLSLAYVDIGVNVGEDVIVWLVSYVYNCK